MKKIKNNRGVSPIAAGIIVALLFFAMLTGEKIYADQSFENQSPQPTVRNDVVLIKNIAQWNGNEWQPLSYGRNVSVFALTTYESNLIAAGIFDPETESTCPPLYINDSIVQWDGNDWSFLSWQYLHATLNAVTVWNDILIAGGGLFQEPLVHGLVQYDGHGSGWSEIGGGVSSPDGIQTVLTLSTYDGRLVVGGRFKNVQGTIYADGLALWDGVSWDPIGAATGRANPKVIYDVCTDGDDLIVGGAFNKMGGILQKNLAIYGSYGPGGTLDWSNQVFITTIDGDILSVVKYNGDIIVGGRFTQINGIPVNHIARWDGNQWYALDGGMTGENAATTAVHDLIVYNGALIAGGCFNTAGDASAVSIARWDGASWDDIGGTVFSQAHTSFPQPRICALHEYDGNLIAAGDFFRGEQDLTPPVTICILEGDLEEDVYVDDVTVSFEASDDMSGVNYTLYKLDAGEWTTYTDSFIVSEEGEHTVLYFSVDNQDNIELEQSTTFTIDFPVELSGRIEGGSSLTFAIENIGRTYATDIIWEATIEGGFFIRPREFSGTFTGLPPGESRIIDNKVFGIGLGKLFPLPSITFTCDTPESEPVLTTVNAKIFFSTVVVL